MQKDFPTTGLVRLAQILAPNGPIPVSPPPPPPPPTLHPPPPPPARRGGRASKTGAFPAPVKLGPRPTRAGAQRPFHALIEKTIEGGEKSIPIGKPKHSATPKGPPSNRSSSSPSNIEDNFALYEVRGGTHSCQKAIRESYAGVPESIA